MFVSLIILSTFSVYSIAFAHVTIPTSPSTSCGSLDSIDLRVHAANQIDERLALASSTNGLSMYTNRDFSLSSSTAWTPNPNSWTKKGTTTLDFTGVAGYLVYSNGTAIAPNSLGTLISPRHFIAAAHYSPNIGHILGFIDSNGNRIERTVMGRENIAGTDIEVGVLDSDLPDSITYYPIAASTTMESMIQPLYDTNYYGGYNNPSTDVPIVIFDQEGKALIHQLTHLGNTTVSHIPYTSGSRAAFSEGVISGDSGNPGFIIIDNQPVLLFAHFGNVNGPNYGNYISQINAAMTNLGGGYQVTEYNPSCFTQWTTNHIPTIIATSTVSYVYNPIQSSSTPVADFTGTDIDAGQTLTFSISNLTASGTTTPLNYSDFFTFATTSNKLILYQKANIDPAIYGGTLTMTVKAQDDASGNSLVGSSTVSKLIFVSNVDNSTSNGDIVYDSQFTSGGGMSPYGMKFDSQGTLFVKDQASLNIYKFDASGNSIGSIEGSTTPLHNFSQNAALDFYQGFMYMTERDGNKVLKINPETGQYISTIGVYGTGAGQYQCPAGLTFDHLGNMFITDTCAHKIMKYDSSGTFLLEFGSSGTSTTQFNTPTSVAADSLGYIYVADYSNNRIQKFDSNGNFVLQFGSLGINNGDFNLPGAVAIDSNDNIYVADINNSRLEKFNSNGNYITQFGSSGSGIAQFNGAYSLALDANDDIYVGDYSNHAIKKLIQLVPPQVPVLQTSSDTGTSNSDGITTVTTPTFDISCTNTRVVNLYANSTLVGSSTCSSNVSHITSSSLSLGTYSVTSTQGNDTFMSSSSLAFSLQVINTTTANGTSGGSSGGGGGGSSGGGGGAVVIYTNTNANVKNTANSLPLTLSNPSGVDKLTDVSSSKLSVLIRRNLNINEQKDVQKLLSDIKIKIDSGKQIQINSVPILVDRSNGSKGEDVRQLQKLLNALGYSVSKIGVGSTGKETTYFGVKTQYALATFQKANGIRPAVGYFGPTTRGTISKMLYNQLTNI